MVVENTNEEKLGVEKKADEQDANALRNAERAVAPVAELVDVHVNVDLVLAANVVDVKAEAADAANVKSLELNKYIFSNILNKYKLFKNNNLYINK